MARANRLLFSRKLFNPNFYHLVNELKNPFRRFIFSYGGSSSGKSYSFAQAVLVYCCLIEGSNTLVFKKVSKTNPDIEQCHMDHIIPISLAESKEEVLALSHYSNCQWLAYDENIRKRHHIVTLFDFYHD